MEVSELDGNIWFITGAVVNGLVCVHVLSTLDLKDRDIYFVINPKDSIRNSCCIIW